LIKKWIIFPGIFFLGLILAPFYFSEDESLFLNQFFIQEKMIERNTASAEVFSDYVISKYLFGWNNIMSHENQNQIILDEPKSIFNYVFSKFPSYSVVYPTETYYYFLFDLHNQTISGNIRLLDADKGIIHLGYFTRDSLEYFNAISLDNNDGVNVELEDNIAKVTYQNRSIWFKINDSWKNPPKDLEIMYFEEFVSRIRDESSLSLFLFFNNETNSFYYILNEEDGVEDQLIKLNDNYLQGKETKFIFYYDKEFERKVLVGVHKQNILKNNYYDGPFDQVPPRLSIKEKVLDAYPYTAYRGGIDEHGRFLEVPNTRIAITPYDNYESTSELIENQLSCKTFISKSEFWSCLTYEWKKDFHKEVEKHMTDSIHQVFQSQGWPANHYGNNSFAWPSTHDEPTSKKWPKNHLVNDSTTQ